MCESPVIIIGGDHFNTLGLVRCFGINGIKPIGIIVDSPHKYQVTAASRFWEKTISLTSDEDAYNYLVEHKHDFKNRPVLVPASDGAEYMIDTHLDELSPFYILPSIKSKSGEVAKLMNKYNQYKWAKENNIKIAKTWEIELSPLNPIEIPSDMLYPCILKPVLSHEGVKADIARCENCDEMLSLLKEFIDKGYFRILVQEFLNKDFEMELFGCVLSGTNKHPFILTKHVREWPIIGGSVCFHQYIDSPKLWMDANRIIDSISKLGFRGNVDVELFNVKGQIYLNEINFRNSGDIYASFADEIYYPYYSYLDMIGKPCQDINYTYTTDKYAMLEVRDIYHVALKRISLKEWIRCLVKTRDFASFFWRDLRPTVIEYYSHFIPMVKNIFSKGKLINNE